MTATLPGTLSYGFVTGRFVLAVADTSEDPDVLPNANPVSGKVTFTSTNLVSKETLATPPTTVIRSVIPGAFDENGDLYNPSDPSGPRGLWLVTGNYKVSYSLSSGSLAGHEIVVLPSHTEENPLNLLSALPPGGPVLNASEYAELSARIDALETGGTGGGTMDHTALTNRNAPDQHPMSSITGLVAELESKAPSEHSHGGSSLAQVGTITLPATPALGERIYAVADATTTLPTGVVWDSGGAPVITGRCILLFVWDGVSWLGTYTPQFTPLGLADVILSLDPVGYWKLNETSGTTAIDYSGSGRNGTYVGGYTLAADGVTLNGSTGYVDLGDRDQWSLNSSGEGITFFLLVRPTTTPATRQALIAKGAANAYEYAVTSIAPYTGQMEGSVNIPVGTPLASDITTGGPLTGAAWHAVAYAAPHPNPTPFIGDLYVNSGTPQATYQGSRTTGTYVNNASTARIGAREGSGLYFNGRFRHAAIFPRKLTSLEVASLVNAASAEGLV